MKSRLVYGDSIKILKKKENKLSNKIDCIISDIPYGISYADWDVLHNNTNISLLGSSPANKNSPIFKTRGKPLNGWSNEDKLINEQYYHWCLSWTSTWFSILKPCGSVFIFAGRRFHHKVINAMEDSGFIFKDLIAWEKSNVAFRSQHLSKVFDRRNDIENSNKYKEWRLGNLKPIFEPILWFIKPYPIGNTISDNVLQYNIGCFNDTNWNKYNVKYKSANIIKVDDSKYDKGSINKFHPTQKPIKLIMALIDLVSMSKDNIILDPFMGSGTTCLSAKLLNRLFIGIEINKDYYNKAMKRISSY